MDKTIKTLDGIYKVIKCSFRSLEPGQQLSVNVRNGNEYINDGQFYKSMQVVKSKGRFRNPDNYRRDWTIKSVVSEIEWYKDNYFYSVDLCIY